MGQISLNPNRVEEKRKEKRFSFYFEWNLFNLEEGTPKLNSKKKIFIFFFFIFEMNFCFYFK